MAKIIIQDNVENRVGHYFGNQVSGVRVLMQLGKANRVDVEQAKNQFLGGLLMVIAALEKGELQPSGRLTQTGLSSLHYHAKLSDWNSPSGIKVIYAAYGNLIGEEFDEKLFEGMKPAK